MNRLIVNALYVGIAASLAVSVAACNRSASADAGAANAPIAAQPDQQQAQPGQAPPDQAQQQQPMQQIADNGVQYAQVVSVTPVRQSINNPKEVCRDEVVNHTEPPKDQHHIAGTAIGAVAGGLLGHLVGSGKGNTLATVAGAVGGGYAGNRIEAAHQQGQVVSTVERHCSTVDATSSKIVAYDVSYVFNGVTRVTRMDHDPGDRVQVQQGVTVVSDAR